MPHSEILTYEQMIRLVKLCVGQGIRKVRVTGGEPLVRKGVVSFLKNLCDIQGLEEVTLTTNGVLLRELAQDLGQCGISRINVSMDTLKPERFKRITRRDLFTQVWEGIEAAVSAGLHPIKINVVAMKGVNDDEVLDFARLTQNKPYHIRFIELMPGAETNSWESQAFLSSKEILDQISTLGPIQRVSSSALDGPSQRYILEGAQGEIGVIGAMSHHFCGTCNRLRLTADGHLRGCLFSDRETDLKTALRQGQDDHQLTELIQKTILEKPKDHGMGPTNRRKCTRTMNGIGG